jgi:hypothetical protein
LIEAREAYHVQLASLDNVVATAIGRYLIQERDWFATHPPDEVAPGAIHETPEPRTLSNSIVRPWSWPAVLVFVRRWEPPEALGPNVVPRTLYLPDGRMIPTCVVLAAPDESLPPPAPGPSNVSCLLGGGYSCLREHQGIEHVGTFGCVVFKNGTYYALTSSHVAGTLGEEIRAYTHGEYHRVGLGAGIGVDRVLMSDIFARWPAGKKTYLNLDAGVVRIDNFDDWTSQAFGVGEVGEIFNATEHSITLDLIDCPVRAFGGTSGVLEGAIRALFFRYETLGDYDHATDVLIGARRSSTDNRSHIPFTRPGDSGTIWFYDPPKREAERGLRARRLRPIAMQWGGQRFVNPDGSQSAFALGSFLSTITQRLDIEILRDWSTGHDEYWGKIGHFAIGFKACDQLSGSLGELMKLNQPRIGFGDQVLGLGSEFRLGDGAFVPLADVPDYVWIFPRENEAVQHFADIDIHDIDGNPPLIEQCLENPAKISATIWKQYFDGFAAANVGPDEGVLPFRVWQLWEDMVAFVKAKDVIHFVAAAGVLAHYIGDASQPLHSSYLHHGVPPMVEVNVRQYPVQKGSDKFEDFKKTREYKIHAIYEEQMLEIDTANALADVDEFLQNTPRPIRTIETGHDAALETLRLMHAAQARLSPQQIIDADDPADGQKGESDCSPGK